MKVVANNFNISMQGTQRREINVVFTSDNNFIRQVSAAMISIFENNKMENVRVYVLSKGILEENKSIMKDMAQCYHQDMQIIELQDIHSYFDEFIDTGGWNDIVLARLFLDKILPNDINRVIYLDGDVIVRHSLKKLWDTDLKGNILGMVMEPTATKQRKKSLGIEGNGYYYNAGILLIDLGKWREKKAGQRIVSFYKAHGNHLFANDQDAINGELKDEIFPLDLIYNYCNSYQYYSYRAIRKMVGRDYYSKEQYKEMISDPTIVHYLGEERPWREGNRHPFRDDFVRYYNMTYYGKQSERKDGVLEEGWILYFFAWNLFNRMMKFFPMLRLQIINKLIPFVMHVRKKKKQKQ